VIGIVICYRIDRKLLIRIKIFSQFFQLATLAVTISVVWPEFVGFIMDAFHYISANIEVASPSCYMSWGWYARVISCLFLFVSVGCLGGGVSWWLNRKRRKLCDKFNQQVGVTPEEQQDKYIRPYANLRELSRVVQSVTIVLLTLLCVPLLRLLLSNFVCVNSDTTAVLVADTSVNCKSASHITFQIFAAVLVFALVAGAPFVVWWITMRIRRGDFNKRRRKGSPFRHAEARELFGSLYQWYTDDCAWFEAVII
jgi:hypothetical protein